VKPILFARPGTKPFIDGAGNLIYEIGGTSPVVFSAHMDTVHRHPGPQEIWGDLEMQYLWKEDDEPLGADDGAGCWMLVELIRAGVPGMYIFHQGEECGGIGSRYIADNKGEKFFEGKSIAIAFDRRRTTSIITEMSAGRTCSDKFGEALGELLGMGHKLDRTGTFTDTANYRKLVEECTNISIGYDNEHTGRETLDFDYLFKLKDRFVLVGEQLKDLPIVRDPKAVETRAWSGGYHGGGYGWDYEWEGYGGTSAANRYRSSMATTEDDDKKDAKPALPATTSSKGPAASESRERPDSDDQLPILIHDPEDDPWTAANDAFELLLILGAIDTDDKEPPGALILDALFAMAVHDTKEFKGHIETIGEMYYDQKIGEWEQTEFDFTQKWNKGFGI
jgi:Peptidase family M28